MVSTADVGRLVDHCEKVRSIIARQDRYDTIMGIFLGNTADEMAICRIKRELSEGDEPCKKGPECCDPPSDR